MYFDYQFRYFINKLIYVVVSVSYVFTLVIDVDIYVSVSCQVVV